METFKLDEKASKTVLEDAAPEIFSKFDKLYRQMCDDLGYIAITEDILKRARYILSLKTKLDDMQKEILELKRRSFG